MTSVSDSGNGVVVVEGEGGYAVIPSDTRLTRLHYFDGKFLRAEHLALEQRYVRTLVEFANRAGGPGIYDGLDVSADGETLVLTPGSAIDPDGRLLYLTGEVRVALSRLIALSGTQRGRRVSRAIAQTAAPHFPVGAFRGTALERGERLATLTARPAVEELRFVDCELTGVVPGAADASPFGPAFWLITLGHADGLCGEEEVFGRLCDDGCDHTAERAYGVEGVIVRARPLMLALRSSRFATREAHLRSLVASAFFALERGDGSSLISGEGLSSQAWCLGATIGAGAEVPLGVVARAGDRTVFLDEWTGRRERMEAPPRRYWEGRMAMRPWAVFLAQILQFQCQLTDLAQGGRAGGSLPDPCAPQQTALGDASRLLADLHAVYPRLAEAAPEGGLLAVEGISTRIGGVLEQIRRLPRGLLRLPSQRVLLEGGIVELPAAGYLPVAPGLETVNRQVRRLVGEGVDLRFCVVRPDYVGHALEEAQHLDRISLLDGLEDPARKPEVDVLVPDGTIQRIQRPVAGTGFEGQVRIAPSLLPDGAERPRPAEPVLFERFEAADRIVVSRRLAASTAGAGTAPAVASTVAVHGAGRAEQRATGGAFHFAGATEVPRSVKVPELVTALSRIGLRGAVKNLVESVPAAKETDTPTLYMQPEFASRIASLAVDALTTNAEARAAAPTAAEIAVTPFAPALARGQQRVASLWLTLDTSADPFELGIGQSATLRGRGVLVFPAATPSWADVTLRGELTITSPPVLRRASAGVFLPFRELGRRVNGRFTGTVSFAAVADGETRDVRPQAVDFPVAIREPLRGPDDPPSLEIRILAEPEEPLTVQASWGGDPLRVEVDVSRVERESDTPTKLANAQLELNAAVLETGNQVHTVALAALEMIGAMVSDPDLPVAAAEQLFPPPPPEPDELSVLATQDWVLFHRRRTKTCADVRTAAAAPPRSYRVYHVRLKGPQEVARVRLALLRNDRDALARLPFEPVDEVGFAAGRADLTSDPNDLLVDWRARRPGNTLLLAAIATYGGADGEQLALSRLAKIEDAVRSATAATSATIVDSLPYVPDTPAAGPDGTIVLVTTAIATTTCHDVYRLDPSRSSEIARLLKAGRVAELIAQLADKPPLSRRVGEARFPLDGESVLPDDAKQLIESWTALGGGVPAQVDSFFRNDADSDAGNEVTVRARETAVATTLGFTGDTVHARPVETLPVDCHVITFVMPRPVVSTCHTVLHVALSSVVGAADSQPLLRAFGGTAATFGPAIMASFEAAAAAGAFDQLGTLHFTDDSAAVPAAESTALKTAWNAAAPGELAAVIVLYRTGEATVGSEDVLRQRGEAIAQAVGLAPESVQVRGLDVLPFDCPAVTAIYTRTVVRTVTHGVFGIATFDPVRIRELEAAIAKRDPAAIRRLVEEHGDITFVGGTATAVRSTITTMADGPPPLQPTRRTVVLMKDASVQGEPLQAQAAEIARQLGVDGGVLVPVLASSWPADLTAPLMTIVVIQWANPG
jgi:hypothetical protein